jgi:hypothetical protein
MPSGRTHTTPTPLGCSQSGPSCAINASCACTCVACQIINHNTCNSSNACVTLNIHCRVLKTRVTCESTCVSCVRTMRRRAGRNLFGENSWRSMRSGATSICVWVVWPCGRGGRGGRGV